MNVIAKRSVYLFLFLFLTSFIVAQPPFETQTNINALNGLQIFAPDFSYIEKDSTFNLHLHVSNISNGFPLTNDQASCYLHLYDITGSHTFEGGAMDLDPNGVDWEQEITSGNFSTLGEHAFYIWCNNSAWELGGEERGTFVVTETGEEPTTSLSIFYFLILLMIILIFGLTLWLGMIIPWPDNKNEDGKLISINRFRSLKILFLIMAYYQFYFIIHVLVQISRVFLDLDLAFDFLRIIEAIYKVTLWPSAIIFIGFFTVNLIFDYKKQGILNRGGRK